MVDHQVDEHPDATLLAFAGEVDEVTERAEARVDREVIGDVVAVVAARRSLKRHQPNAGDAKPSQIVQAPDQTDEITDAITVRVHERADLQRVDDGVLVPEIFDHNLFRKKS